MSPLPAQHSRPMAQAPRSCDTHDALPPSGTSCAFPPSGTRARLRFVPHAPSARMAPSAAATNVGIEEAAGPVGVNLNEMSIGQSVYDTNIYGYGAGGRNARPQRTHRTSYAFAP